MAQYLVTRTPLSLTSPPPHPLGIASHCIAPPRPPLLFSPLLTLVTPLLSSPLTSPPRLVPSVLSSPLLAGRVRRYYHAGASSPVAWGSASVVPRVPASLAARRRGRQPVGAQGRGVDLVRTPVPPSTLHTLHTTHTCTSTAHPAPCPQCQYSSFLVLNRVTRLRPLASALPARTSQCFDPFVKPFMREKKPR